MRALNKTDKRPGEEIFGVCKKIIRKLTDSFFMILDLGTALFGNGSLFTELKENAPLIKHFGPTSIDFDEYPLYSDRISDFWGNVNKNIQCDHGNVYSSVKKMCTWVNEEIWAIMKTCFPDAKQIK